MRWIIRVNEQSILLLDKIKQVCKLITVEGEFSEIFTHRDEKSLFFKLLQLEKKALIIVKAKVLVGFDLTKINIEINSNTKQVKLSHFPEPGILSIDSDIEYYDQVTVLKSDKGVDLALIVVDDRGESTLALEEKQEITDDINKLMDEALKAYDEEFKDTI